MGSAPTAARSWAARLRRFISETPRRRCPSPREAAATVSSFERQVEHDGEARRRPVGQGHRPHEERTSRAGRRPPRSRRHGGDAGRRRAASATPVRHQPREAAAPDPLRHRWSAARRAARAGYNRLPRRRRRRRRARCVRCARAPTGTSARDAPGKRVASVACLRCERSRHRAPPASLELDRGASARGTAPVRPAPGGASRRCTS